jgi:hypothetical protein
MRKFTPHKLNNNAVKYPPKKVERIILQLPTPEKNQNQGT